MKCSDDKWRLVAFISKSLSNTEQNYEIHDKEILALVRCLEVWRHFLEEVTVKFEIWTDHKNLEYFMKAQKLNHRQVRWALYLSRFDFVLKHVVTPQVNFPWMITFDMLYTNEFLLRVHSRALSIPSEHTTI